MDAACLHVDLAASLALKLGCSGWPDVFKEALSCREP